MKSINIKGREIPLIYTVWEMKQVQEEIAPLDKAINVVLGRNQDDENDESKYGGKEQLEAATTLIKILGNAGLEEAGEEANLTEKWIARGLRPRELPTIINACLEAMNEGMVSEIPKQKKTGPVDVVLEEIEKKKEPES